MSERVFNVLFLCTGNTARSVLAEAILNKDGRGRFHAYSAGSQPKGVVNPFALKVLGAMGYPADGYRSKGGRSSRVRAPEMGFIFTVCDSAAGDDLPLVQFATKVRSGPAQWFAEFVATFGLLMTILAAVRFRIEAVPYTVGLYITAAY